ncbi:non-ribosomal peptide synthetase [Streptomyces sp. WAC 06738]|uniref:non-ribosomal peptide synthetase n=1 Tax=Streptomyces sp. WAC 06738 TaxID=2203210 RepID=UPI001F0C8147|nr:non-ribosomal peptide synthetase [Streptomyces sp. WAC 06738]
MSRSLVEDVWPLSPLQEGMLFHAALAGTGPDVYTVQSALDIEGPLDPARLRASWQALLARHAALRACFRQVSGAKMVQVIARDVELPWREEDLSGLTEDDARAELDRLTARRLAERIDLASAPLMRFLLVRLGADRHRLVMTFHHILMDGWSMPVLLTELSAVYAAGGDASKLKRVPSYGQYLAWLGRQDKDAARAAWRAELAGADEPTLVVPADPARAAVFPEHVFGDVPEDVTKGLRDLARAEGLTLNTVVQGAWSLVLARLARRTDVVFGATAAGRPAELAGVESMVGLLLNTLPVRVRLDGGQPVTELLADLQRRQSELMAHQHLGLPEVQRLAGPGAVFDTLVLYESFPPPPAGAGGPGALTIRPSGMSRDAAHYPLTLVVTPAGDRLRCKLDYRPDLFDPAAATAIFRRVVRVLEQVVADPSVRVGDVDVLADGERTPVVSGWNATELAVPSGSVLDRFEARARRAPEAVAVRCGAEELSYGELDARANRLARYLRRLGVGRESRVGLCLPRGVEMVAGMLAAWKAGGAYVPLDPAYPAERLAFMVADSRAQVVLSTGDLAPKGAVRLDEAAGEIAAESVEPLGTVLEPGQLAYVIYTSGSTGRPKGVAVPHRGPANLAEAMRPVLGMAEDVTALQFASFSFDAAVLDVAVTLAAGGTLAIASDEERVEPAALAGMVRSAGVSVASVVPSLLSVLDPAAVTGVRNWVLGAELLTADLASRWTGQARVWNTYGPTEATVITTATPLDADLNPADPPPPIGRPIGNTRTYVLDDFLRPVPQGVTGEVYIAGPGLARGYIGRGGLTAERFVACPFEPGARMYRSGDLAAWKPDGQLAFRGRADEQVKIRGFRVEPGEIEAVLAAHPDVSRAAVVVREDRPGDKRLVAYVVPGGPDADIDAVRAHAAARLPAHMLPAAVLALESLPLTPSGKLDRAALPAPDFAERATGRAPEGETEEALCALFADVLGVERVGADDSFFDLGGDSGLAMRLAGRIREDFGAELNMRQFFGAPTPVGVTRMLASKTRPALRAVEHPDEVPASAGQVRTWLMDRLAEDSAAYRTSVALRLTGELDRDALRAALGDIAARHDALRTIFAAEGGAGLRQRVLGPAAARPAPEVVPATEAELPELLAARAAHVFDLTVEPPWTQTLFTLSETEHVLLLVVHRIAADDESLDVMLRDLSAAYGARREGRTPERAPLPLQFADYALWERELLAGEDDPESLISDQLVYWKDTLAGLAPELRLPADRPRPQLATHRTGQVPLRVEADVHERLTELDEAGEGAFTVVQAALALLLTRLGAGADITVGALLPRRDEEGALEGVVGPFAGPIALRTDTSGDPTFRELLGRVREANLEARRHQDLPFERLVDVLELPPSAARHPVVQVMLDVRDGTTGEEDTSELPGLSTGRLDLGPAASELDLSVSLSEWYRADGSGDGLDGHLRYAAELFDADTAAALARRLVRVLRQVADDPDVRLGDVDVLLDPAEHHRLVREWNDTAAPLPDTTVVGLLAGRAARTPDAVAVTDQDGALTYGALDTASGMLARRLAARGVGAEDTVAVALPLGARLAVALLGVLKAGAACLFTGPDRPMQALAPLRGHRPAALICTATTAGLLPADHAMTVVPLGNPVLAAARGTYAGPGPDGETGTAVPRPGHAALLLDSTTPHGVPAGVVVEHRSLVGHLADGADEVPDRAADEGPRHLTLDERAPVEAVVTPLLRALCAGESVLLGKPDPRAARRALTTRDLLWTLAELPAGDPSFAEVTVIEDGAAASDVDAREWRARHPDAALVTGYGPAGTAGPWLHHRTAPGAPLPAEVPTGSLGPHTRAYVLDDRLRPVPPGAVGDLYVAGATLARGYHGSTRLTGEHFVACPYGPAGERMLRTGERARWSTAGLLTVRDRQAEEHDAALAQARRPEGGGDLGVLLPLRQQGSGAPLFCVHSATGLAWSYAVLVPHLPRDRPVYGIQARGLAGPEPMPKSVAEMAADYADEMRTVQPEGPYHLLGWSFGGMLAQAVAARLEEQGERVELLALLDAYPDGGAGTSLFSNEDAAGRSAATSAPRGRLLGPGGDEAAVPGVSGRLRSRMDQVMRNSAGFAPEHTPRRTTGDLLLFVATEDRPAGLPVADAVESWKPYVAGNVEPHEIEADHFGMLKSAPAAHIGRILAERLGIPGETTEK